MKVNPVQLDKIYNTMVNETSQMSAKEGNRQVASPKDSLVLSSTAKGYSELDGVVNTVVNEVSKATPSGKLLRLKNEIAQGAYHVPAEDVAESMLNGVAQNG